MLAVLRVLRLLVFGLLVSGFGFAYAETTIAEAVSAGQKLLVLNSDGVVPEFSDPEHAPLITAACASEISDLKYADIEEVLPLLGTEMMMIWFQRLNPSEQVDPSNSQYAEELGLCIDASFVRIGKILQYLYEDEFQNTPDWRNDPVRLDGLEKMHSGHTTMITGIAYVLKLPEASVEWREQRAAAIITSIDDLGDKMFPHHCQRLNTMMRQYQSEIEETEGQELLSRVAEALPCG